MIFNKTFSLYMCGGFISLFGLGLCCVLGSRFFVFILFLGWVFWLFILFILFLFIYLCCCGLFSFLVVVFFCSFFGGIDLCFVCLGDLGFLCFILFYYYYIFFLYFFFVLLEVDGWVFDVETRGLWRNWKVDHLRNLHLETWSPALQYVRVFHLDVCSLFIKFIIFN